jgi:eukaryotic-like serine/threonine-protein kinase
MADRIGRFEVMRSLGQGGQSTVLLARDPHLDRPVALKLLRLKGEAVERRTLLLREARFVGSLRHPGIVPIFEAGEHGGDPYLVFEYVEGETLAAHLKRQGPLPPARAAAILVEVLDALHEAHATGVVHRDLKPGNIFITPQGQVRVIDFGIATRIGQGNDARSGLAGTPAYMAPEYIAGGVVTPQNDVFAAGLLLYECLFGHPAYRGEHAFQILHRVANEPLVLPADATTRVNEQMLDLLAKATAKDPALRFASARAMQQALKAWLGASAEGPANAAGGALAFLLLRMRHKSDFPAMSASISQITRMALTDHANAAALSNLILKDLALTNKILRLANSVHYGLPTGGRVNTVSRAIVILGFDAVRNLAISLMLFEHIADKQHAEQLKDEFLRANLRGLLARTLCAADHPEQAEQAFLCGLFHGLGRLLAGYYFREEAEMIARIVERERCDEETAALRVLGLGYAALGQGVAESWNFPAEMVQSMRRLPSDGPLPVARKPEERLQLLAGLADLGTQLLETGDAAPQGFSQQASLQRYCRALGLPELRLNRAAEEAVEGLRQLSDVLGLSGRRSRLARLLAPADAATRAETSGAEKALIDSAVSEAEPTPGTESLLSLGIQDISRSLVDDGMQATDVLCAIAELLYRALGARRVLLCLRESNGQWIAAKHGFGSEIERLRPLMRLRLQDKDLFNLILARDVDVLISDASAERIQRHLPAWYRQHFDALSFLVLPLRLHARPEAMIYAESAQRNGISLSPEALSQVRTLRNQALMALKLQR